MHGAPLDDVHGGMHGRRTLAPSELGCAPTTMHRLVESRDAEAELRSQVLNQREVLLQEVRARTHSGPASHANRGVLHGCGPKDVVA